MLYRIIHVVHMHWSPIHFLYILVTYMHKKYFVCDLNSVQDPDVREYFQEERTQILQTKKTWSTT